MVESFYKNGLKTKRYHYIVTYCSCCRHRATQNTNKVAGHRTFSRLETRLKCKLPKRLTTIGTALDDYGYGRIIGTETDIHQKLYCVMYHTYDSVLYVPEGSQWVVSIQKSTLTCIGINVLYVIVLDKMWKTFFCS